MTTFNMGDYVVFCNTSSDEFDGKLGKIIGTQFVFEDVGFYIVELQGFQLPDRPGHKAVVMISSCLEHVH